MKSFLQTIVGVIGILAFLTYSIGLFVLGYIGIETYLGTGWAIGFVIVAVMLKFTFPMFIGSIYGAMVVFGVNIWIALLIAMPTIIFIIPAMALGLINVVLELFKKPKRRQEFNDDYIDVSVVE